MNRSLIAATIAAVILIGLSSPTAQQATPTPKQTQTTPPQSAPVNLNAATKADLEKLPGIGPAMAQRILDYRQKNGSFKKVEELMNIQGIGEKAFLKLRTLVTVAPPKTTER